MLYVLLYQQLLVYLFWVVSHYNSSVGLSEMQITNCEITVSVCIMEGTDTRASGITEHFPQMLKYEDFLSINSILKELYCVSEAPLDVLKFEL
jgi:hypothetical protein